MLLIAVLLYWCILSVCVCVCCLSNCICVQALSLDGNSFVVTRVLITSQHFLSAEACVSFVETQFNGAGLDTGCACMRACLVWFDLII